jgi:hypothetical protein
MALIASGAGAGKTCAEPASATDFVRLCAPAMSSHAKDPERACGCLEREVNARVADPELRAALLAGIRETGVPSVRRATLDPDKQSGVDPALSLIARPAFACLDGG